MWYELVFYFILLAIVVGAAVAGEMPELLGALACLAAAMLTVLTVASDWQTPEWAEFAIDVALVATLWAIGVRFGRWWTAVAASFIVVSALGAVARWMDPSFDQVAYAIMTGISSYPVLVVLMIALTRHRRPRGVPLMTTRLPGTSSR